MGLVQYVVCQAFSHNYTNIRFVAINIISINLYFLLQQISMLVLKTFKVLFFLVQTELFSVSLFCKYPSIVYTYINTNVEMHMQD